MNKSRGSNVSAGQREEIFPLPQLPPIFKPPELEKTTKYHRDAQRLSDKADEIEQSILAERRQKEVSANWKPPIILTLDYLEIRLSVPQIIPIPDYPDSRLLGPSIIRTYDWLDPLLSHYLDLKDKDNEIIDFKQKLQTFSFWIFYWLKQ